MTKKQKSKSDIYKEIALGLGLGGFGMPGFFFQKAAFLSPQFLTLKKKK